MGKVIGKVIATEKNPSTIDDFYFWTKQDLILNPFDVVKVNHLQHSVSYGVIEEISHITDPNEMGSIIAAETIAAVIREDQEKKNTDNTLAYYNQNVLNFICTTQSVDLYTVNS